MLKRRTTFRKLTPGTPVWMEYWKKHPKQQKAMVKYTLKLEKEKVEKNKIATPTPAPLRRRVKPPKLLNTEAKQILNLPKKISRRSKSR